MHSSPYREFPPHPALRQLVDCFWVSTVEPASPHRVLPDGCVDLLLETTAAGTRGHLIGAMTRPLDVRSASTVHFTAVRFRPGGAWPFFDQPLSEWTDQRLAVAELWSDAARLEDAVAAAADQVEQVEILQGAILERLARTVRPDRRAVACVAAIRTDPGAFRLGKACRQLGTSRQFLTRKVKELTGLGPKQLARILRLQRALEDLRGGADLAAAAAVHGYSDQAHLTREVRGLTGWTPAVIRRAAAS